ncbi:hypothetical protein PP714_08285 [Lacticaseibacillus paracasei]|nr:hypothetical protein [Lacticaseibacillus paracasei]
MFSFASCSLRKIIFWTLFNGRSDFLIGEPGVAGRDETSFCFGLNRGLGRNASSSSELAIFNISAALLIRGLADAGGVNDMTTDVQTIHHFKRNLTS